MSELGGDTSYTHEIVIEQDDDDVVVKGWRKNGQWILTVGFDIDLEGQPDKIGWPMRSSEEDFEDAATTVVPAGIERHKQWLISQGVIVDDRQKVRS